MTPVMQSSKKEGSVSVEKTEIIGRIGRSRKSDNPATWPETMIKMIYRLNKAHETCILAQMKTYCTCCHHPTLNNRIACGSNWSLWAVWLTCWRV
mmetsp:Transcript_20694/g.35555  ORF Transcript_20694/g.35555 Transcript_20694/m.35555 type:complete len:95 (-) Transcript_20694:2354-2638(-)